MTGPSDPNAKRPRTTTRLSHLHSDETAQEDWSVTCPECNSSNRSDARFCMRCGTPLKEDEHFLYEKSLRLHPGMLVDGRYKIEKKIGEGGLGRVYLASDSAGRRYAVKQIRERHEGDDLVEYQLYVRSFQREASILTSLPHPYLPIARDFIMTPDDLLIVMDYIEGKTLSEIQESSPAPLSEKRVLHWAIQVCDALNYLHTKNPPIIHRNIKPKNIVLEEGEEERVRLIGFGLARHFIPGLEHDEENLGTQGYSPPEQYGLTQTDPRSDLFSLGATMFTLLSKHDPGQYVTMGVNDLPEFRYPDLRFLNSLVSPQTSKVVMKALQAQPEERFQSAGEMKSALEAITAQKQASAPVLPVEKFYLNKPVPMEETRQYEFKEVKGENPLFAIKRIVDEYVVAFLNSDGGRIFWGIRDDDRVVVGVRLNYRQRDAVRRLITDKIFQVQPAVSPSSYRVNLHEVFEGNQPRKDLYVVEVIVRRPMTNLLYFTGPGDVFIKTDAGKKKLSGSEIHDEILRRLQKGGGIYPKVRS